MNNSDQNSFERLAQMMRRRTRAELFPPPMIGEVAWDILLALAAERHGALGLDRLACLVSARSISMSGSLRDLEERRLISFRTQFAGGQPQPALTRDGRELLDNYLTAASDLQLGEPRHVR